MVWPRKLELAINYTSYLEGEVPMAVGEKVWLEEGESASFLLRSVYFRDPGAVVDVNVTTDVYQLTVG